MSTEEGIPKRGEIWLVDFNPSKGEEIRKVRPAVVVSSDAVGVLKVKLVAPITGWNERFANYVWLVRIEPSDINGLDKRSAVDVLQLRGVSLERFKAKKGRVSPAEMEEIATAIAAVIEYI